MSAKHATLFGAAVGTMSLAAGWVLGGSQPGSGPASETAAALIAKWADGVASAERAFSGLGMAPGSAAATAALLGVLAPAAVGIAVSSTGRMAVELGKQGVRGFWQAAAQKAADRETRERIEAQVGKVETVFSWSPGLLSRAGYMIRTEDGAIHEVDKAAYQAFRRELIQDKAAVVSTGDSIMQYTGGKLSIVATFLREQGPLDGCEIVTREPASGSETRQTFGDWARSKLGAEPPVPAAPGVRA